MNREKKIITTSIVGILANLVLVAGKAIIGFIANSTSVIMDAVNNLSDVLSSVITIIGTKLAGRKPDKDHPFGHGKIEYLTALVVAVIVLIAGGTAIYESILSLIEGKAPTYSNVSLIVISVAVLVKIALGLFFKKVGKDVSSDALKGSGLDALFDAILSFATLISALISMFAGINIEGYLGIAIGCFIIKSGIEILLESSSNLIGKRAEKELAHAIKDTATSFDGVYGAYDLILNNYGPNRTIGSLHIEVDADKTAKELHALSRAIAEKVFLEYGVILTVGIYSRNNSDPEIEAVRNDVSSYVAKNESIKEIHAFYYDETKNLITFDIIVLFKKEEPEKVKEDFIKYLKDKHPKFKYYIVVDYDFSD